MADEQVPASNIESTEAEDSSQEENLELSEGGEESAPEVSAEEQKELEKLEAKNKLSKPEQKRLRQLLLKVDGEEETVDLPFDMPDDPKAVEWMKRQLQMSKMSTRRAQEKSDLERDVSGFIEELRKNPRKALSNPNIGVDIKKLAAEIIEAEIEDSRKSPEQLRAEQLEAELKQLKEERENAKKEREQRDFEALQEKAAIEYDTMITEALESSKTLPKSPYTVAKMATYLKLALENNIDLKPSEIVPIIEEDIRNEITSMFSAMPAEIIEQVVGKDKLAQIRRTRVAAKRAEVPPTPFKGSVKDVAKPSESKEEVVEKKTFRQFFGH
jgi:hypothetical protein